MSFNMKLAMPSRRQLLRLFTDLLVLAVILTLATNFKYFWFATTQRGFFCDDETLMYPYKESTVNPTMLFVLCLDLPLALLIILEICQCLRLRSSTISGWLRFWPLYNTVRYFLFGYAAQTLLKVMGKQTIGRLRPNFFAVCQPLLSDGGICSDEAHRQGGVYHTQFKCQPELSRATDWMLSSAHVSFPSGHSSTAFYGLVFMALHLQRSGRCPAPLAGTLLRPLCQLVCLLLAWFIALSRVLDNKHHWSDVAVGSLLGAGVALVAVLLAELEAKPRAKAQQQQQQLTVANAATHANENEKGDGGIDRSAGQQLPQDLCLVTCHSSN